MDPGFCVVKGVRAGVVAYIDENDGEGYDEAEDAVDFARFGQDVLHIYIGSLLAVPMRG